MQPRSGDTSRSTAQSLPSLQSQLRAVLANTASLNQLLKLSRAFKHSTHILATTPAPVRSSCGVSFWQTLQKRSVRGKATGCDEYPGHESIVWPPMVDIMLLGWCPCAVRAVLRRYWHLRLLQQVIRVPAAVNRDGGAAPAKLRDGGPGVCWPRS